MGGFVLDYTRHSTNLECPSFTIEGILRTAKTEPKLLDFSQASIEDKSRTDGLSKLFVCTQASYMVLQILGRIKEHLPITLLKVNTMCHVLCAFAMYGFWFHKPMDVKQTISIQPDWAQDLDAIWSMRRRKFSAMRQKPGTASRISEREVFNHYRVETLYQLVRGNTKYEVVTQAPDQLPVPHTNGMTRRCVQCQRPRHLGVQYPQSALHHRRHSSTDLAVAKSSSKLMGHGPSFRDRRRLFNPSATDVELDSLSSDEMPLFTVSNMSENEMDPRSSDLSITLTKPSRTFSGTSGNVEGSAPEDIFNTPQLASDTDSLFPAAGLPEEVVLGLVQEDALCIPSPEAWLEQVIIEREKSTNISDTAKNWEGPGFVLVWHSCDPSMTDQSVKDRLSHSKLWIQVRWVVLVKGYKSDKCYFGETTTSTRADVLFLDPFLDFANATGGMEILRAVQLNAAGSRRWELAFDTACELQSKKALGENPTSYEDVVMTVMSHFTFPTATERELWRISCLIIACSGALATPAFVVFLYLERNTFPHSLYDDEPDQEPNEETAEIAANLIVPTWTRPSRGLVSELIEFFLLMFYLLVSLLVCCYVAARLFIGIEAFASLRLLPMQAYQTPSRTDVLLHR